MTEEPYQDRDHRVGNVQVVNPGFASHHQTTQLSD